MAGTVAYTSDNVFGRNECAREVVITCTADAAANTYPDTNLASLSGLIHGPLSGWVLYAFETDPGATGPTDNTDLYLKSANGTDLIAAQGVDKIDNAANNLVFLTNPFYVGATLTLDIDNNSVASAVVAIKLYLRREF